MPNDSLGDSVILSMRLAPFLFHLLSSNDVGPVMDPLAVCVRMLSP